MSESLSSGSDSRGTHVREALRPYAGNVLLREARGSEVTTMAVGGPLRAMVEPATEQELVTVVRSLLKAGVSYRVLGFGSNVIIPDLGVDECVIRLGSGFRARHRYPAREGSFTVGGAASLMGLSRDLSREGFSGIEFAGGIPASLGGAIRMNAGAHGRSMADIVREIRVLLPNGEVELLSAAALGFAYRRCRLPEGSVVIEVTVDLSPGDGARISAERTRCLEYRKRTQPLALPSSGSVFRNPDAGDAAGALLESAGMKGVRENGAMVSTLHANWIVNPEREARAVDVLSLVARCQEGVRRIHGITLEPELVVW